jgi:phosphonatase-like hydrolase
MTPKLAVLDMAGTTVNDHGLVQQAAINTMKAITQTDITIDDANKVMGIPKNVAFEQLCSINNLSIDNETINQLLDNFNSELENQYSIKGNIELMPFADELFDAMRKRGTKIYLNTGFNRKIAEIIVNQLDLKSKIDGFIGSDEVKKGRPHPDMILLAMKKEGVEYSHKVMKIGDTVSDLYEGFSAGCAWNIGVLTGAQTYNELLTAPYTQILNNLERVIAKFEKK